MWCLVDLFTLIFFTSRMQTSRNNTKDTLNIISRVCGYYCDRWWSDYLFLATGLGEEEICKWNTLPKFLLWSFLNRMPNKSHDLLISYIVIQVREQRSVKLNYMQIQIVFLVIADGCSLNVNTYDLERRQLGFSQTVVMNID